MHEKIVYLTRSWPGGGKSFEAKKLCQETELESVICSADDYFMHDGVYVFDREKLDRAHGYCQHKFLTALEKQIPIIVVDNTNINFSACKYYIFYGAAADYKIKLVEGKAPWRDSTKECFARNQHGVPLDVINKMKNNFQPSAKVAQFALENLGVEVEYE